MRQSQIAPHAPDWRRIEASDSSSRPFAELEHLLAQRVIRLTIGEGKMTIDNPLLGT